MEVNVNNKIIRLKCEYINEGKGYHHIEAISDKGESMGYLNFCNKGNSIWFHKVEVKEKFQHRGVGTSLIYAMEYYAYKKGIKNIEGKYFPENEYAKPMYNKLGYCVDHEYYDWYVTKNLDFDIIKKFIAPNIKNFRIKNEPHSACDDFDSRL